MLKVICSKIKHDGASPVDLDRIAAATSPVGLTTEISSNPLSVAVSETVGASAGTGSGAKKRKSASATSLASCAIDETAECESGSSLSALCFIAEVVDSNTSGKIAGGPDGAGGASSKQSSLAYSIGNPIRRRSRAATITSYCSVPGGVGVDGGKSGRRSRSGSTVSIDESDSSSITNSFRRLSQEQEQKQEQDRSVRRRILNSSMQSSNTGNVSGGGYEGEEDVAALLASLSNHTNMDLNSPVRHRSNSMITSSTSLLEKAKSVGNNMRRQMGSSTSGSSLSSRDTLSRTTVTSAAKFAGSTITFPRQNSDYVRKQSVPKSGNSCNSTLFTGAVAGNSSAAPSTSSLNRHFKEVSLDRDGGSAVSMATASISGSTATVKAHEGRKTVVTPPTAVAPVDGKRCSSNSPTAGACSNSDGSDSSLEDHDRDQDPAQSHSPSFSDGSAISAESDEQDDEEDSFYYRQICHTFSNNGSFYSSGDAQCTEEYISRLGEQGRARERVGSLNDSALSQMSLTDHHPAITTNNNNNNNVTCLAGLADAAVATYCNESMSMNTSNMRTTTINILDMSAITDAAPGSTGTDGKSKLELFSSPVGKDNKFAAIISASCCDDTTVTGQDEEEEVEEEEEADSLNQGFLTNTTVCVHGEGEGEDESSNRMDGVGENQEDNCGFADSNVYVTITPDIYNTERSSGDDCGDHGTSSKGDHGEGLCFIGAYSPDERYKRLIKFFSKRNRRVWTKRVKYDVRKNFADSRVRVKGRFVKKEDEEFLMKEHIEVTAGNAGGEGNILQERECKGASGAYEPSEAVESKNSTAEALMSLISS